MQGDFYLGGWLVQPQLNSISGEGRTVRVEPRVMEVLMCLAARGGEVLSKDSIIRTVWADRFVTDEVLTTAIFELRKALGDSARDSRFIQTVPRRGYRLIAPLSKEADSDVAGVRKLSALKRWWKPLIAALVIGLPVVVIAVKIVAPGGKENTILAYRVKAEAYSEYEKGRQLWNTRSEEALKRATGHFERAIAIDSGFAPAYAELADVYHLLVSHNYLRPEEAYPKAKAAALKALELDARLGGAHAALAINLLAYEWDWNGAQLHFNRALALDPENAKVRNLYAQYLWAEGRLEDALAEVTRARELDPTSISFHMTAGDIFFRLHRWDESLQAYKQALSIDPTYSFGYKALSHVYYKKSMPEEADASYRKAMELSGMPSYERISRHFLSWSRGGNSRFLMDKMSFLLKQKYVRPGYIALLYLDLGDRDLAFEWLERAYAEHDSLLLFLKTEESWAPLRDDARFLDLVNRVGPAA